MIHTLSRLDWIASAGRSPWHRASALSKLMLTVLIVMLAVFAPNLKMIAALHLLAWTLTLTARLPWRLMAAAAGYPIVFSLLFVIARWDGTAQTVGTLMMRPLAASIAVVWLIGTTPYPDLFAPISRLLPRGAADGLFLTYRALFELMSRLERMVRALRLRGGADGPARRRLTVAGEGLGTLVLYGFERSQRLHAVMLLRGHGGRICGCRHWAELTRADLLVAAAGATAIAAAVLTWRTG